MSGPASDTLSPAADASDASGRPPPASKRRRTGGTSRGVANLTPEQLARKRANDREAQRAIRERTKNQIDRLNARIQELESQQPYQDLRAVVRDKEIVVAENLHIKKKLEDVLAMLQPLVRPDGLNGESTLGWKDCLVKNRHRGKDCRRWKTDICRTGRRRRTLPPSRSLLRLPFNPRGDGGQWHRLAPFCLPW